MKSVGMKVGNILKAVFLKGVAKLVGLFKRYGEESE